MGNKFLTLRKSEVAKVAPDRVSPHKRELNEKLHEMNNIVYFNSKTL